MDLAEVTLTAEAKLRKDCIERVLSLVHMGKIDPHEVESYAQKLVDFIEQNDKRDGDSSDMDDVNVNEYAMPETPADSFRQDLKHLINRHGVDSVADTPDWVLADALVSHIDHIAAFNFSRDSWFGFKPRVKMSFLKERE